VVLLLVGAWAGMAQSNRPLTVLQRLEPARLAEARAARNRFAQDWKAPINHGLYEDFRAVIHLHAEDADHTKGTRAELLAAAKRIGARVVMTTDHRGPKPEAWRGLRDGVLFIAGSETGDGATWFPEYGPDSRPIPGSGLQFLSHVEERYDAPTEGFAGLEVVNRHSDAILDKGLYLYLMAAVVERERWNQATNLFAQFPDEFFAAGVDYREKFFAKWDQELERRPFTAIGANDAHQNMVVEGITFDPYEVSLRHVSTHILASELTEPEIRQALREGRAYVAHDWLADPTGFSYGAVNTLGVFPMGGSAPLFSTKLMAYTPLPARLKLVHKGKVVQETTGTNLTFDAVELGAYRVEAWLAVGGEDRPWIYSNPIYLRAATPADMSLPSSAVSDKVEVRKDINYLDGPPEEAAKHRLDVYIAKSRAQAPVLFFVHGGAWRYGDRSQYPALGGRYAEAGLVVVVPSYRLAPKYPHPAQVEDVAAAFAWTVRHIAEHGGDTNQLFVGGHSAGGHLVALLTLDEKRLQAHQLSPKLIRGVLALSGVYDFAAGDALASVFGRDPEVRRDASPLTHVKPGAPPFLVTYCQWDYPTLPAQAKAFHAALQRARIPAELVLIPRENHISEMTSVTKPDDPTVAAALKFLLK
jgi:acetyl esterase/lipase